MALKAATRCRPVGALVQLVLTTALRVPSGTQMVIHIALSCVSGHTRQQKKEDKSSQRLCQCA
jgi:hypothetical protein